MMDVFFRCNTKLMIMQMVRKQTTMMVIMISNLIPLEIAYSFNKTSWHMGHGRILCNKRNKNCEIKTNLNYKGQY